MPVTQKIAYGLERLSDVFKSLLWDKAKTYGISPIQIQLLLFIESHRREWCNVTYLSKEFNLTKPTISDAIKVLCGKGYLEKDFSTIDSRSYLLFVTPLGKKLITEINDYSFPIEGVLSKLDGEKLESLYEVLLELIFELNQQDIIKIQRMCLGCRFYERKDSISYCKLLKTTLKPTDIRLDCEEFEEETISKPH